MKLESVHRESRLCPLSALCRSLRVSCYGYHAWIGRAPSEREAEDRLLTVEITAAFVRSRKA